MTLKKEGGFFGCGVYGRFRSNSSVAMAIAMIIAIVAADMYIIMSVELAEFVWGGVAVGAVAGSLACM